VIAYNAGGATETIIAGKTGEFFDDYNNSKSLKNAVLKLENNYKSYLPQTCQNRAKEFSEGIFRQKFKSFIEEEYKKYQQKMR